MKSLFRSRKKDQATKDKRAAREVANSQQRLLQLPAELRNQIYELLLPADDIIRRKFYSLHQQEVTHKLYPPYKLPPLLRVCRQVRAEVLPLFYGSNLVSITLQHLLLHRYSSLRLKSCANLLPDYGTTSWRQIKLESSSRCFHADGFAVLANVDIFIDRGKGIVTCVPRGSQVLRQCCKDAQKVFSNRVAAEIKSMGLHERERKLRPHDFERLAQRMDENRTDWPMAPRRVIPRRDMR